MSNPCKHSANADKCEVCRLTDDLHFLLEADAHTNAHAKNLFALQKKLRDKLKELGYPYNDA